MRARIRTVKPEALLDEKLWDLEVELAVPAFRAFVGLWTQADREGRFEWRPRALKAACVPYWDGDFARVLDAFASRGFVRKYRVAGREYGLVINFKKHQAINNKEQPSELPAPEDGEPESPNDPQGSTRRAREDDATSTRENRDDNAALSFARGTEPNRTRTEPEPSSDRACAPARTEGRSSTPTTTALRGLHEAERTAEHAIIATEDALNAIAAGAYSRALHEAQGMYEVRAADREHFVTVGRLAERVAARDAIDLRATLAAWATRYVSERRQRSPKWWAEHVTAWVGASGAVSGVPLDPDRVELARLDAALNAARTRGDHDEVDRVRAEQRAFLDRVQRRTA